VPSKIIAYNINLNFAVVSSRFTVLFSCQSAPPTTERQLISFGRAICRHAANNQCSAFFKRFLLETGTASVLHVFKYCSQECLPRRLYLQDLVIVSVLFFSAAFCGQHPRNGVARHSIPPAALCVPTDRICVALLLGIVTMFVMRSSQ